MGVTPRCVHAIGRNVTLCRCVLFALTLVHPLIHGSMLDGGVLDAVLLNAQLVVAGTSE